MIIRIGSGATEANTITIPAGHQPGDVIFIAAFRDGSTTNPTIPAGFTNITNTFDGTLCSVSAGWKIATSAAETSGTWTNATALVVSVYRGIRGQGSPFGTPTNTAATGATVNYGALTLNRMTSWLIAVGFHVSTDTTGLVTPPTSFTLLASNLGATCDVAIFDTNGVYKLGNYVANNVSHGGTNAGNQTMIIELKKADNSFQNFMGFSGGDGGSFSEKII